MHYSFRGATMVRSDGLILKIHLIILKLLQNRLNISQEGSDLTAVSLRLPPKYDKSALIGQLPHSVVIGEILNVCCQSHARAAVNITDINGFGSAILFRTRVWYRIINSSHTIASTWNSVSVPLRV